MSVCVKCGFENTGAHEIAGNVEYKDKCYMAKCGWEDRDVDEHLHVSCPNCGYQTARPCSDYSEQKAKFARPEPVETYPAQRQYQQPLYGSYGRSRVDAAWDTKDPVCSGCPVEK